MAFARHATSKIASFEDLEQVRSLGFRGEALASIASVARVVMASRAAGAAHAFALSAEAGSIGAMEPAAQPTGTAVEVNDLYYNTPARRKFMRATRRNSPTARPFSRARSCRGPMSPSP